MFLFCVPRGEHRYLYLWTRANAADILRHVEKQAADPALNFTWNEAALVSEAVREGLENAERRDENDVNRRKPR